MIIEDIENLNEEQKKIVEYQSKYIKTENISNELSSSSIYFRENGYVKIKNFISEELANYFYTFVKQSTRRLLWAEERLDYADDQIFGTFTDPQAHGDFSKYGDPVFDSLLEHKLRDAIYITGVNLIPTYSYHRLYTTDTILKRHKDRPSCEISATICLGHDTSNVDTSIYPNYNCSMFVSPATGETGTEGTPIQLKPGDAIFYRGCQIEHWREPYLGKNQAQVFLHYNEKDGEHNRLFDLRPELGLPGCFRSDFKKKIS